MKTQLHSLLLCSLLTLAVVGQTFANNNDLNGSWTDAGGLTCTIIATPTGIDMKYETGFGAAGRIERFRQNAEGSFVRVSEIWLGTYRGDVETPDNTAAVRVYPWQGDLYRYENNVYRTKIQRVAPQPANNGTFVPQVVQANYTPTNVAASPSAEDREYEYLRNLAMPSLVYVPSLTNPAFVEPTQESLRAQTDWMVNRRNRMQYLYPLLTESYKAQLRGR